MKVFVVTFCKYEDTEIAAVFDVYHESDAHKVARRINGIVHEEFQLNVFDPRHAYLDAKDFQL